MRLRLPKNRRHRIYLYLHSLLVILTALDILLVHLGRHITVAPDTTRITTPLRPDGTPDYLQALEARASAGITPDNNAAVPLVALLDPATPDLPPTLFTALHLQPPTASRPDSFQTFSLFYQRQHPGSPPIDIETKILKAALADAPFTRPDAAAWTDANADALDALHTITRLPHYHMPYTCDPANDLLINMQLPELHPFRQMGHALVLRARLRIDAGQLDAGAEDLAAAHHLAALLSHGSQTAIERVTPIAIDAEASQLDGHLLTSPALTPEQTTRFAATLDTLPPLAPLVGTFDTTERWCLLDALVHAARRGPPWNPHMLIGGEEFLSNRVFQYVPVNFNATLRTTNALYDRLVAAAKRPAYPDQIAGIRDVQHTIETTVEGTFINLRPGMFLVSNLFPAFDRACILEAASLEYRDLARTAAALARYRALHHAYPPTLAALSPSPPRDRFTGAPLQYTPAPPGYLLYSVGPNGIDNGGQYRGLGTVSDDLAIRTPPPPPPDVAATQHP